MRLSLLAISKVSIVIFVTKVRLLTIMAMGFGTNILLMYTNLILVHIPANRGR